MDSPKCTDPEGDGTDHCSCYYDGYSCCYCGEGLEEEPI